MIRIKTLTFIFFVFFNSCEDLPQGESRDQNGSDSQNSDPTNFQQDQGGSKDSHLPTVSAQAACQNLEEKFLAPQASTTEDQLKKKYEFEDVLKGGKSGDALLKVKDKKDGSTKVLKLFTSSLPKKREQLAESSYREIAIGCELAQISFADEFAANTDTNLLVGTFFPKLYEVGTVDTKRIFEHERKLPPPPERLAPDGTPLGPEIETGTYAYVVMEYLKGNNLDELSVKNPKSGAFQLRNASKAELLGMIYQLLLAVEVPTKLIGFSHRDMHPGNVRLLEDQIVFTTREGIHIRAPRTIVFDYGLSVTKKVPSTDTNLRETTLALSGYLSNFGLPAGMVFVSDDSPIKKAAKKSSNVDVRFYNQIFAGIWEILRQRGDVQGEFPYCGPTWADCYKAFPRQLLTK